MEMGGFAALLRNFIVPIFIIMKYFSIWVYDTLVEDEKYIFVILALVTLTFYCISKHKLHKLHLQQANL
jgi:hypothetical protein